MLILQEKWIPLHFLLPPLLLFMCDSFGVSAPHSNKGVMDFGLTFCMGRLLPNT